MCAPRPSAAVPQNVMMRACTYESWAEAAPTMAATVATAAEAFTNDSMLVKSFGGDDGRETGVWGKQQEKVSQPAACAGVYMSVRWV